MPSHRITFQVTMYSKTEQLRPTAMEEAVKNVLGDKFACYGWVSNMMIERIEDDDDVMDAWKEG